jgi:hypothetical protein
MTAIRNRLRNRRPSETRAIESKGMPYTVSFSRFDDGSLAEIFLSNHKAGSQADTNARDAAVIRSIALQYGVPAETIRRALMRDSHGRANSPLGVALDLIAGERSE